MTTRQYCIQAVRVRGDLPEHFADSARMAAIPVTLLRPHVATLEEVLSPACSRGSLLLQEALLKN